MRSAVLIILLIACLHMQGQDYFQQQVDYEIEVTLNDEDHTLQGNIKMNYQNNSSDALQEIYIHLWPNAYSSPSTDLGKQMRARGDYGLEFSKESERGNISGLAFKIDDKSVSHEQYEGKRDIAVIRLSSPLQSGQSIEISTPFFVKIPSSKFSRLGHIGQSYQITQWYPKPAVYDKDGWHPMPYLNQGEFYSEFGSFHVTITLPENYVVGATGELQEESEIEFLKKLAARSSQMLWKGMSNEFPPSSAQMKTIHYHQDSIHDFAWFADKRFHVIHQEFQLDSGKELDAWVYFTNKHSDTWAKSLEYVVDGTKHYSRYVGDYPYSHVSVVDGTLAAGGGMEYPMITVINGTSNELGLEQVIVHEIGHNWFYGILASNERSDPWMDEGINSYYEQRYFKEKYPERKSGILGLISGQGEGLAEMAYRFKACRHQDQPLSISSDEYSSLNYGVMVYMKGALTMSHLSSVLGVDNFDDVMQSYFHEWKFKHPGPADMQTSLESSLGQDLDWFFEDVIGNNAKIDHRIHSFDREDNSVIVSSKTSYDGPVAVGFYQDSLLVDYQVLSGDEVEFKSDRSFDQAIIDPLRQSLELSRRNDRIGTSGILRTWEFPEFRPVIGSGLSRKPGIFYSPAIGWNEQDEWMLGAYFSNTEIIGKNLEWTVVPMYSTIAEDLVGLADLRLSIFPTEQAPDRFEISLNAKRFSLKNLSGKDAMYSKLSPQFVYSLRDPAEKKGNHEVFYRFHYTRLSFGEYEVFHFEDEATVEDEFIFNELGYNYNQKRGLNTIGLGLMAEFHDSYQKATAEASFSQIYDKHENEWSIRAYGGKMWVREFIPIGAQLSLNGQGPAIRVTDGTYDDYRFDQLFLGRGEMEGLVAQQFVRNRGGFVQSTTLGATDNWVLAFNAELDLPIPLPLSFYVNYGFYDTSSGSQSLYESGVRVELIADFFDVYFPAFISSEISDSYEFHDIKYLETVRFQLRLDKLGIRKMLDNVQL